MADPVQVFSVRLWSEDLGDGRREWRGQVRHASSGEALYFRQWSQAWAFVQACLQGSAMNAEGKRDGCNSFHQQDTNRSIVRRLWEEVWNSRDFDLVGEIMSPDYAEHEKQFAPMWLTIFPDAQFAVEEMIAEGDKVVSRVTFRGTHQAEYKGIPATGRSVEVKAVWIHRLAGGRIVEGKQWGFVDWLGLLQQLGATIAPPASDQESRNSLA